MKILKQPDIYQCEVCGFRSLSKVDAIACESSEIPIQNIKEGTKVLISSRYDGYLSTKIVSAELTSKYRKHTWEYTSLDEIEICKDGTTSNKWTEKELIVKDSLVWLANIPEEENLTVLVDAGAGIYSWKVKELKTKPIISTAKFAIIKELR